MFVLIALYNWVVCLFVVVFGLVCWGVRDIAVREDYKSY